MRIQRKNDKDAYSMIQLLDDYGIDYKKNSASFKIFCPFHGDGDTPNLQIYTDTESWFCFSCNKGGGAEMFVMYMDNCTYAQAEEKLYGHGLLTRKFGRPVETKIDPNVEFMALRLAEAIYENKAKINVAQIQKDIMEAELTTKAYSDFLTKIRSAA